MVPLYTARIGDLEPCDFVNVERAACGQVELLNGANARDGWREAD